MLRASSSYKRPSNTKLPPTTTSVTSSAATLSAPEDAITLPPPFVGEAVACTEAAEAAEAADAEASDNE
jgi:hypothetical protein